MKKMNTKAVTRFFSNLHRRLFDVDFDVFSVLGAFFITFAISFFAAKIHRSDPLDGDTFIYLIIPLNIIHLFRANVRFQIYSEKMTRCLVDVDDAFRTGQISKQEADRLIEIGLLPYRLAKRKEILKLYIHYSVSTYLVFLLALVVGYEIVVQDCDRYFHAPYTDIMGHIVENPFESVETCIYLNDFYPEAPSIW